LTSVEILATGPELIRQGIRGTEPVVEETIQSAKKGIQVIAYVFTYNAKRVLDLLDQAARKGVKVAVTVNNVKKQESRVKTKLEKLEGVAPVFDFDDPHGKQVRQNRDSRQNPGRCRLSQFHLGRYVRKKRLI